MQRPEARLAWRFALQDAKYRFPYHHVPHFDEAGRPHISRSLRWGLEYLVYTRHIAELIVEANPKSVLDIGCGDGRLLTMLPVEIERRVGCDLSTPAIRMARAFDSKIEFLNVEASAVPGRYDVVTAVEVLEHVPEEGVADFLTEAAERVRHGGKLILSVPSVNLPLIPKHYRHYTEELVREHVARSRVALRALAVYGLIQSRNVLYKLYRMVSSNGVVDVDSGALRSMVWSHLWKNRVRESDGMHWVGVFERG